MHLIQSNASLTNLNTFHVASTCDHLAAFSSTEELLAIMQEIKDGPIYTLGGGSNVLLIDHLPCTVLHNQIDGMEIAQDGPKSVLIKAGSGVVWNELVNWAVQEDLGGIENLSLIPGKVGAAPIQNIGAYGVELAEIFDHLTGIELETGAERIFSKEECRFGYRDSIFKREYKSKIVITSVTLELTRDHKICSSYGAISQELKAKGIVDPSIKDIQNIVNQIRSTKLPDPSTLGNAGSFFKNPVIANDKIEELKSRFPMMPCFPEKEGYQKLAAAWLIDSCGWRGKSVGPVGCHKNQALVIVNHGGASGQAILDFSEDVHKSVLNTFGISLEREVNVIQPSDFSN